MTERPGDHGELVDLREDVDYLLTLAGLDATDTRAALIGASTTAAGPPARAHVWHTLSASEAAAAWDAITGWVDWLIGRYGLEDVVPACWYRHGAMVDELDGLRAAWIGAYDAPSVQPVDACHWLELLGRTIARIREWDRYGCAAGTHHEDPPQCADDWHDERLVHIHADIAVRAAGATGSEADDTVPRRQQVTAGDHQGDGSGDGIR